jgi:hypothetical protein
MRWYSRELDRSHAVIEELEARSLTCQAALAAIEACWDQVMTFLSLAHMYRLKYLPQHATVSRSMN